jgi:anti-sigma factor RsiW
MSEHTTIRELLPLAASGDISPEEMRRVRAHLAGCEACRRVSEDFTVIGSALRGLPTPQPRAEMVAQVCALAGAAMAGQRERSNHWGVMALLVAASWLMTLSTWPVVRPAAHWMFTGWHLPGGGIGTALAVYSIAGLVFACISAIAVGRHAHTIGRVR